jgi:hypothetical protein
MSINDVWVDSSSVLRGNLILPVCSEERGGCGAISVSGWTLTVGRWNLYSNTASRGEG